MWYQNLRLVTAAVLEDTLAELAAQGAQPMVLDQIRQTPADQAGYYVGGLKRNPLMSLEELTEIVKRNQEQSRPRVENSPTQFETQVAQKFEPQFQQWALVQLRKLRDRQIRNGVFSYKGFGENASPEDQAWNLTNSFQQISDWANYMARTDQRFQLPAYNFTQAAQKTHEWHLAMAGEGNGQEYTPYSRDESGNINDHRIVYTYPDGWHVTSVNNENDLTVEGNRMGHCVGDYCNKVEKGYSRIFSLRDPRNHPEATIEMDGRGNAIYQIKGPYDSRPEHEIRLRIAEWLETMPGAHFAGAQTWPGPQWSNDPESVVTAIYEEAFGREGGYDDWDYADDAHSDYGLDDEDDTRNVVDLNVPDLLDSVDAYVPEALETARKNPKLYKESEIIDPLAEVVAKRDTAFLSEMLEQKPDLKMTPDALRQKLGVFQMAFRYDIQYEEAVGNSDARFEKKDDVDKHALADQDSQFRVYYLAMNALVKDDSFPELREMYTRICGSDLLSDLDNASYGALTTQKQRELTEKLQPRLMKHKEDYSYGTMPITPTGDVDESAFDEGGWSYAKKFSGWYRLAEAI